MIMKFTLTATNFAGLAKFLANDDNNLDLLKEFHPGCSPSFVGSGSYQHFATILKTVPHKGANTKESELDVTVLVAEQYHTGPMAEPKRLPHQYINRLFRSVGLYPFDRTFVRAKVVDSDAPARLYKDGYSIFEHIGMGEVRVEKRLNGKLYINDVEVTRRLVPKELGKGESRCLPFLPGENKECLLNACFYDALIADPLLIPEDWRGETYFRGTIFQAYSSKWIRCFTRNSDDKLYLGQASVGHYNLTQEYSWEAVLAL